jgi:hypothetical protein
MPFLQTIYILLFLLLSSSVSYAKTSRYRKKTKKKHEVTLPVIPEIIVEPLPTTYAYVNARIYFRQHHYRKALAFLQELPSNKEKWIAAESYFRLDEYVKAKELFGEIYRSSNEQNDRKIILMRLFECSLALKDVKSARQIYNNYRVEFKQIPVKMRYAMAKNLLEINSKQAINILKQIPVNTDFSIRAKYILATISVKDFSKKPLKTILKPFEEIEKMPVVSIEDTIVKNKATLAKARIYAHRAMYEEALAAYEIAGFYEEEVAFEAITALLKKADDAAGALGPYKKVDEKTRIFVESQTLSKALDIIQKYKNKKEIDWLTPRLFTVMAHLYARSARYDEGRQVYDVLISHYKAVKLELVYLAKKSENLLPFFDLSNFNSDIFFVEGLPSYLLANKDDIEQLLNLKNRLLKSREDIEKISKNVVQNSVNYESLQAIMITQKQNEEDYRKAAMNLQIESLNNTAKDVNEFLAQAEYQRAELAYLETQNLKKQLDTVWQYQTDSQDNFNKNIQELDKNGGSL